MVHTSHHDEFDAEDLEEFFENAPVPIQCLAPDGTVLQANWALLDLLGYERGRYVGQPFVDFHADSAVVVNMHAALTNGEPVRNMPARLRCQDGSVREVLISSSAYWKEDQLVHTRWLIHDAGESKRDERRLGSAEEGSLSASTQDIADREQVEQELPESEARFRTLAEKSRAGILMAEGGRHIYVNPRYAEITGYTKAELLSMTLDDVVTPDTHQIIEQRLQARLRGEPVPEQYETRILTKRGETRWVDVSAARVVIDGRSVLLATSLDVTDRKRAERNLQESEAKFRALAEKSRAGIMVTEGARFTYVNPKYIEITGYTKAELLRMGVADMVVSESRQMISERREARLRGEAVPEQYETQIVTKRGETRWIEVSATTVIDITERPAILSTVVDITERKQAEQALRAAEAELRHAQKMDIVGRGVPVARVAVLTRDVECGSRGQEGIEVSGIDGIEDGRARFVESAGQGCPRFPVFRHQCLNRVGVEVDARQLRP